MNALDLLVGEVGVDADDLLEQVRVDRLVPPVRLDLLQDSIGDGAKHAAENLHLELGVPLVRQTRY